MIKILIDKNYEVKVYNGLDQKKSDDIEEMYKAFEKRIKEASNRQEMKRWFKGMETLEKHFDDEENLKKLYYIEPQIKEKKQFPLIIIDLTKERIIYLYTPDISKTDVKTMAKKDIIQELKNFPNHIIKV